MENDKIFLRRAIEIAAEGIRSGGGPFGAVIVKDGKIISEAFNRVVLNNDPTAHAEILAIREAASVLKSHESERLYSLFFLRTMSYVPWSNLLVRNKKSCLCMRPDRC